jgi:PAS domain S-box-containing protein
VNVSERDREAATTAGVTVRSDGAGLEHPLGEVRRQSLLAALTRHSLEAPSLDEFFRDAAGAVADGLGVEIVGVFELMTDRPELFLRSGVGWSDSAVGRARVAVGAKSQAGYTLVAGRVISPDLESESRFAVDALLESEGVRSGISVSVPGRDRPFGVLAAHSRRRRQFHTKELEFLRDVAYVIGEAIGRDLKHTAERARTDRLREALDAGSVGVWEWSPQTDKVTWSETLERIHGREPGTFGGTFHDFERDIHPEDRERVLGAVARASEKGEDFRVEYRSVWPDGTVRWLEAKGAAIRDASGRVVGMAGVCLDVDERARSARRRDAQYAITRALAEADTLEEASARIVRAVCECLGWDLGGVWEVNREQGIMRSVAMWRRPGLEAASFEELTRSLAFTRGLGLPGRVWADGRPHWIPDVVDDANFPRAQAALEAGLHGAFAFPILFGGAVGGVVEFFSRELREPDDDLLAMVEAVGSQIGQFVQRKRLERELRLQKTLLEAQSEASIDGILVVSRDLRTIFFNRRFVELWQIAPSVVQAEAALAAIRDRLVDPDEFLEHAAYLDAHPAEESRAEIELADGRVFDRYSAPVQGDDGTHYGRVWFFRDISEQKRHEENLRFLAQASELLSESLDYEETLERVARLAVPVVADWCVVDVLDELGELRRVAVGHADPEKVRFGRRLEGRYPGRPDDPGGPARVVQTGVPELAAEIPEEFLDAVAQDEEHLRMLRKLALCSYVSVPLRGHRRVLGAITLAYAESGRRYDDKGLALARDLARHAALAIENSRLYRERSHVANTLQRSLLPPRLPAIPGVEIAVRFRPFADAIEIGGDFYDVFPVDDRIWAFAIGDVCGKGPEAAALTGLARHTIRAAAMRERSPSAILAALNEAILTQHGDESFCTVACGFLERNDEGAHLTIASGGHPLPFVLRSDGATEEAAEVGTLVGFFPSPTFADRPVELGAGDALVLYTDGVTSGPVREDGLEAVVRSCAGLDADGIAERLEQAVSEARSSQARDDVAILVLRAE